MTAAYLVNADEIQIKMAQGAARRGRPASGYKVDRIMPACATPHRA